MTFNAKLSYPLTDKIYKPKVINALKVLNSLEDKLECSTVLYLTEPEISLLYQIIVQIKSDLEIELN